MLAKISPVTSGLYHEPNASNRTWNGLRPGEFWVGGRWPVIGDYCSRNSNRVITVHVNSNETVIGQ